MKHQAPSESALPDFTWTTTAGTNSEEALTEAAVEAFLIKKVGQVQSPMSEAGEAPEEESLLVAVPSAGNIIGGRYRLEAHLASGGMGSVWTARHIDLDAPVAIKLMDQRSERSSRGRARFLREARAAAKLRSRNVVTVLDYGVCASTPYIVMERLEGEDLWAKLARQRTMPLEEAAWLLESMANALALAHAAGIIHRDLKPENIFLARVPGERDVIVKVLDFGLAKELAQVAAEESTTMGVVVGTPYYMSPEQALGSKVVDHRSDLWSLGVILYLALTGMLPFEGAAPMAILNAIVSAPLRPPSSLAPHLPVEVDSFFARALKRNPNARFQSAREMVAAFHRLTPATSAISEREASDFDVLELASGDFVATDDAPLDVWA